MTDATNDWNDTDPARKAHKTSAAAAAATFEAGAPDESKSFGAAATPAELAQEAEALVRKSLETIKVQAEDLKRQSAEWTALRTDQARELIDERPLTVVAAAFGLGLILGALVSR